MRKQEMLFAPYPSTCAECGYLFEVERFGTLTCSTACRVKAHRNGSIKVLRQAADACDGDIRLIGFIEAARLLDKEASGRCRAGEISISELRTIVTKEFVRILFNECNA